VRHPGGKLGRKPLRVEALMHQGSEIPRVGPLTPMKEVLFEMTRKRLGLTTVTEPDGRLLGLISDGDLRRQMERHGYGLLDRTATECMTREHLLIGRRSSPPSPSTSWNRRRSPPVVADAGAASKASCTSTTCGRRR
jgi:hypothetical protein